MDNVGPDRKDVRLDYLNIEFGLILSPSIQGEWTPTEEDRSPVPSLSMEVSSMVNELSVQVSRSQKR